MQEKVDIEKLAILARIKLDSKEKEKFQKEFEAILNYVSKLDEVDVGGVEGEKMGNITGLENITREDVFSHGAGEFSKDLLKEAPAIENDYVKVKQILE